MSRLPDTKRTAELTRLSSTRCTGPNSAERRKEATKGVARADSDATIGQMSELAALAVFVTLGINLPFDALGTYFWGGLAVASGVVLAIFLATYHGRGAGMLQSESRPTRKA